MPKSRTPYIAFAKSFLANNKHSHNDQWIRKQKAKTMSLKTSPAVNKTTQKAVAVSLEQTPKNGEE